MKVLTNEKLSQFSEKIDSIIEKSKLPRQIKNKYYLGGLIILLIILPILFLTISNTKQNIPVYKIYRSDFLIAITESGELRAKNSISIIAPRVRGTLKIVFLIPEGTYVQPGEVVCKFDPSEAIANQRDAESKLELARMDKEKLIANQKASMSEMNSQLKGAELGFELSKLKLEQVKFEAQAIQQQTKLEHEKNRLSFEQTKQEYESKKIINKADLERTEVEIRQKENDLKKSQTDLDLLTVKAPCGGLVVYSINFNNQGRKFAIGDSPWAGAEIITLPDLDAMESKLYINEVDVSRVKPGQKVIVKLDAFQDSSFIGELSSIASIGKNKDASSNIKVFECLVSIKQKSRVLRPGMTTSNKIIINEIPNSIFIPLDAIFEKEGKTVAYLKNGSSYILQQVEVGDKSDDYIIVKTGAKDGDEVALIDPTASPEQTAIDTKQEKIPRFGKQK